MTQFLLGERAGANAPVVQGGRVSLTVSPIFQNAQRAPVPMVNIVADQATYHCGFDAPLSADIEGWARPVSVWTRTARSAGTVGLDAAAVVHAARNACDIAMLILPPNVSRNKGDVPSRTALDLFDSWEPSARLAPFGRGNGRGSGQR
jgi:thiamine pyrophosphate-dependent acetolactate synthase large subunit-like protein